MWRERGGIENGVLRYSSSLVRGMRGRAEREMCEPSEPSVEKWLVHVSYQQEVKRCPVPVSRCLLERAASHSGCSLFVGRSPLGVRLGQGGQGGKLLCGHFCAHVTGQGRRGGYFLRTPARPRFENAHRSPVAVGGQQRRGGCTSVNLLPV